MEFCLLSKFFFNIRLNFAKFILCHLCFFISLLFDDCWWHVTKYFDVKNNNLGKLHMYAAKTELGYLEK